LGKTRAYGMDLIGIAARAQVKDVRQRGGIGGDQIPNLGYHRRTAVRILGLKLSRLGHELCDSVCRKLLP
jgi:hypothetical protein